MRYRIAFVCLLLLGAAATAPARRPGLGAFSAPTTFRVTVGGQTYEWTGTVTLTPSGSEARRSLSGTGAFVLVPPGPTPTPPPVPTPTPTPTPPPPPVPTPGPNPGTVLNVRDYGVKGDGVTIDRTALNSLIQSAPAGATLYFPSGTYLTDDALKVYRNDVGFLGDGDSSIIKSVQGSYNFQIGHGGPVTGISFRKLQLYGTPHSYMADGTARGGVLNFGGQGVVFSDCVFTGCAEPILNAGVANSTYGTVVKDCRFNGWGRMCIFCDGGERISGCKLIQDDPNLYGERSSHGFYIHGGVRDVEVADTEIANVRKYACQIYSESEPSVTDNVRLLRLSIKNCANGIITAHGSAAAGRLTNGLIEGCMIAGTYAGSSLAIKNSDSLIVRNNVIDGNSGASAGHTGAGIYFGVWSPSYEQGFSLANVLCEGNTVRSCDRGIWTLPSGGGSFTNVIIRGNLVSGNRLNYDITGPGIAFTPGRAPGKGSGIPFDLRPSDDSSRR